MGFQNILVLEEVKNLNRITILPAKGCRRSKKILDYLQVNHIPFQRIELDSLEGARLMKTHNFLASPGILIDGSSVNPYDILDQKECRVDSNKALKVFSIK